MTDTTRTKQMQIHNPNNLPTIDYRKVIPLQGNLKDLTEDNAEKLYEVLTSRGFKQPLNLWKKGDKFYAMDGHQRQRVMKKFDLSDNGSYEVPYFLTEADNEQDAKAQLLEITSQYGTITYEGIDEFLAVAQIPEATIVQTVTFDALYYFGKERPGDEEEQPEKEQGEGQPTIKIVFKDKGYLESALADLVDMDFTDKYDAEIKVTGEKK